MDHEMSVEIDAGYWLTAPHVCSRCQQDSPVTILVVTEGSESWANVMASIDAPAFVIDVDCDLPLEVVKQRWHVNANLGMPTQGERILSDLANVCQHCGTRIDDLQLIAAAGPFLPSSAAAIERLTCTPLEHTPFTAREAEVCDEARLRGLLRRITHPG